MCAVCWSAGMDFEQETVHMICQVFLGGQVLAAVRCDDMSFKTTDLYSELVDIDDIAAHLHEQTTLTNPRLSRD